MASSGGDPDGLAAAALHASSDASGPEESRHADDSNTISDDAPEQLNCFPGQESNDASVSTEKNQPAVSKCKSVEELPRAATVKRCKTTDSKKLLSNNNNSLSLAAIQALRKPPRKGGHPVQLREGVMSQDKRPPSTWICKNAACKAVLTSENTFCKRCSCCICHLFDDNKDPSLWLVCSSETGGDRDCCESSCHVECALQRRKAGRIDLGQSMHLDGHYCCAACGKVIGILGFWKRQLAVAKDARRVDILCSRIYLSHRLLDGTIRFKELHQIVEDAKAKLETEVGPLDGMSSKMARGIVGRLPVAADVQNLCSRAMEKADDWLQSNSQAETKQIDALPTACRFRFEDITALSLVIVLKETASSPYHAIKGYKLWYWNSREPPSTREPAIFPKDQRILISNLQPCTEYAFRIISFTEDGELGHSESKCFTRSVEIIHKNIEHGAEGCSSTAKRDVKSQNGRSSGFIVRQLGKVLRKAWAEEDGCPDEFCKDEIEDSCDHSDSLIPDKDQVAHVSRKLDLNENSVPDLNAEVVIPTECLRNENGCENGEAPAMESRSQSRKQTSDLEQETCAEDGNLVTGSQTHFSRRLGQLDDHYEYCVKIIRWLERSGHIEKDFRMRFLTWFSLRSTEQERRVVFTFIRTLLDEPSSLAGQLLDSFEELVAIKRARIGGFCTKLWH